MSVFGYVLNEWPCDVQGNCGASHCFLLYFAFIPSIFYLGYLTFIFIYTFNLYTHPDLQVASLCVSIDRAPVHQSPDCINELCCPAVAAADFIVLYLFYVSNLRSTYISYNRCARLIQACWIMQCLKARFQTVYVWLHNSGLWHAGPTTDLDWVPNSSSEKEGCTTNLYFMLCCYWIIIGCWVESSSSPTRVYVFMCVVTQRRPFWKTTQLLLRAAGQVTCVHACVSVCVACMRTATPKRQPAKQLHSEERDFYGAFPQSYSTLNCITRASPTLYYQTQIFLMVFCLFYSFNSSVLL